MVTRFVHQVLRVRVFLALLVLSAILSGCGKSNVRWVVYDETLCADKWEYSPVNEKLKDNIVAYFKGKGVKVLELEIFNDRNPDQCSDCTCKTGRRVKCKVKKRDVDNMKGESFYTE
jgi:hypothetical protein